MPLPRFDDYKAYILSLLAIFKGFTIGFGLIAPIGVQNSYILSQGIKQNFHFTAATFCILCDLVLMSIGVFGGSALIHSNSIIAALLTWGGIIFLTIYGGIFLKTAIFNQSQTVQTLAKPTSRVAVILTTLAVTLLNPHVYLDTIVIIGSISGQFAVTTEKLAFLLGTCLASVAWFYTLSASAAKFSPWLNKPTVQRGINILIAFIMWSIAISLVLNH